MFYRPVRRLALSSRVTVAILLSALLVLASGSLLARARSATSGAPPASPGLSEQALQALSDVVQRYIDRDMAVSAELVVIEGGHTVLHEAYGWRDREAGLPMQRDTIFNIRSMTKPVTGAAIQILIDEGKLALDDPVSTYLPGFDTDASRPITVEQLLTHRSGLPISILTGTHDFESLEAMANAIGQEGPQFEPDSRFWYSDAGADVLGALVERVSGTSLEDFVTARVLEPLGMTDAFYAGDPEDPRLERVACLYVGTVGGWTRFWDPDEEPFYPYAWGSQSLYSSPLAYARFLTMWMDDGLAGEARVLSPEAVERTLTPVSPMSGLSTDAPYPTRFPGLTVYHGQMAVLHADSEPVDGGPPPGLEPSIIGYSGSDGTIAWAWPERDLIILYFTQSRGGASPIRLEEEIDRLLLHPRAAIDVAMPAEYTDFVGTYTADFGPFVNQPFEVLWRDGSLALDIPSGFIMPLDQDGQTGRWTLRDDPSVAISFERAEDGTVAGLRIHQGGGVTDVPKGLPSPASEQLLQPEDVAGYLGTFRDAETGREVEVVLHAGRLALRIPESSDPLDLFPPDASGAWRLRMNPTVEIVFTEEDGSVVSYVARGPGGEATFIRADQPGSDLAG